MIKKYNKLVLIVILSLSLEGCWDYEDINRRSIDLTVGLDKRNDKIQYDTEFAEFSTNLGKGKDSPQVTGEYHNTAAGNDFEETRTEYNTKIPFVDFSGATRAVVFSKGYAQEGIEQYINRIDFLQGLRKSVLVVISREATDTLLNAKIVNDISVGYAIEDTVRYLSKQGGAIYVTAQKIQSDIQFNNIGFLVPYVGLEKNSIKYLGFAVMKDSKLMGTIEGRDIRGVLFIAGKKPVLQESIVNPEDHSNKVSIEAVLKKRKIKTSYSDNKINIDISLNLDAKLQYLYFLKPLSSNAISQVEATIANQLKKEVNNALEKSKSEYQSDIFGFARYFKADNPRAYKQLKWKDEYPNVNFNVNVNVNVVNSNLFNTKMKRKS